MKVWQIQEAKAKLTKLIRDAKLRPQIISRRGVPEIVAMSMEKYNALLNNKADIVSFFKNSPLYNINLELERDRSGIRELDL